MKKLYKGDDLSPHQKDHIWSVLIQLIEEQENCKIEVLGKVDDESIYHRTRQRDE